jgi:hypothetical protein
MTGAPVEERHPVSLGIAQRPPEVSLRLTASSGVSAYRPALFAGTLFCSKPKATVHERPQTSIEKIDPGFIPVHRCSSGVLIAKLSLF